MNSRLAVGATLLTAMALFAAVSPQTGQPARAAALRAVPQPTSAAAGAVSALPPYQFENAGAISIYRPRGQSHELALFLSGDGGWNLGVVDMARALARQGITVAGLSAPALMKSLERGHDQCVNPSFVLTRLAADVEHRLGWKGYVKPILVGYSSGATIAYAGLAQAPAGTWRGGVSLGFGPDLPGAKPWCDAGVLSATAITRPERGWLFASSPGLPSPWLVVQGLRDQVVSPEVTRRFTARVPSARLLELPKVGHGFSVEANWIPQFVEAFRKMFPAPSPNLASAPLPALPLNLVAGKATAGNAPMAVLFSGDGGWAGLDREVAAELARSGIPVVGVDSLSYFWTARTPSGAAADLSRILDHFGAAWGKRQVILVGYSFGADVLPSIVQALPADERAKIARVSLIGLDDTADFQFHLLDWVNLPTSLSRPTLPLLAQLRGMDVQCLYGREDTGSACSKVPVGEAHVIALPGGHHFDGAYDRIAQLITDGVRT